MMSLAPRSIFELRQRLAGLRPRADFATTGSNETVHHLPVCDLHSRTLPHSPLCPSYIIFLLSANQTHTNGLPHTATMSGISGHLVRRGAQMAQVHFTKITSEHTPEHESAPAMEIDPMEYLPAAAVAIVTVLLIASVSP
jgi:hypothetical protein